MIKLKEHLELLEACLPGLSLADEFFKYIFPDIMGHAKIIDKFFSYERAPFYETVEQEKIKFYNEADVDLDWMVQQCYLLLIAAATKERVESITCGSVDLPLATTIMLILVNICLSIVLRHSVLLLHIVGWMKDTGMKTSGMCHDFFLPCLDSYNNC